MLPSPPAQVRLLLKPKEAAAALAISERTLWQLTKDGEVPCLRLGRAVRYDVAALQTWVERQQRHSPDAKETDAGT